MDYLKKAVAPLSTKEWVQIEERAKLVLTSLLAGRRVAKVYGPVGREQGAVNVGRLTIHELNGLKYGINEVKPFVETRINFVLSRWEMDNIDRGAKDTNWDMLDAAVKQAALFEEKAIFYGLPEAGIDGLLHSTIHPVLNFGTTPESVLDAISQAVLYIEDSYDESPYALVVGEKKWILLNSFNGFYNFTEKLNQLLPGGIYVSRAMTDEAVMVPFNDENIEFTLGEDFGIGYQESEEKTIKLYVTESFTFRVLDKSLVVVFK